MQISTTQTSLGQQQAAASSIFSLTNFLPSKTHINHAFIIIIKLIVDKDKSLVILLDSQILRKINEKDISISNVVYNNQLTIGNGMFSETPAFVLRPGGKVFRKFADLTQISSSLRPCQGDLWRGGGGQRCFLKKT